PVPGRQHVTDPGREYAAHAGDLFVDPVGDPVGYPAQLGFGAAIGRLVQLDLAHVVHQPVADGVLAAVLRDRAVGQVVLAARLPGAVVDLALDVEAGARGADQPELTRSGQVGADDFGHRGRAGGARAIGDGERVRGGAHT